MRAPRLQLSTTGYRMKLIMLLLLLLPTVSHAATVGKSAIVLLQPEAVLQKKNPDIAAASIYVEAAQERFARNVVAESLPPTSGFIVFAIRKGGHSNVWLDFEPALPEKIEAEALASIKAIPPFKVAEGTMVFAVMTTINGAAVPDSLVPYPDAWRAVTAGNPESFEIEALVDKVWP